MITLENAYIQAKITEKGAELQSLFSTETNVEYLWSGDATYWAKRSPILFPIVGSLKDDTYRYRGKEYALPRHGFARDYLFDSKQISATEAVFTLSQSDEILQKYPFYFTLAVKYTLIDRKLNVTYEVLNTGSDELLFSLGAHPAFAVPNTPATRYEDYYLTFNDDEKLVCWQLEQGLLANSTTTIPLNGHKLKLDHALFVNDALVLKNLQSNCVSLLNVKNDVGLHFHFDDFPFFGIWAAPDAPFVCLEPWCGVADSVNHTKEITQKEGVVRLEPAEEFVRFWEVECF
ncbi:aldose 1-epimerase family protein [Pedobacter sp. MW01-1-1]|uniref:aldose 1-epimerase family protein n=1 Tax=Pedobacter sp. MW01-1-1 TaxID=3383027 RepID=UPI003FEF9C27